MLYLARAIVIDPFDVEVEAEHRDEAVSKALRALGRRFSNYSIVHGEITSLQGNKWHVHYEVEIEIFGSGETEEDAKADRERNFHRSGLVHPSVMITHTEWLGREHG